MIKHLAIIGATVLFGMWLNKQYPQILAAVPVLGA